MRLRMRESILPKTDTRTGKALVDLFQKSPFYGIELDLTRDPPHPNDDCTIDFD